MRFEKTIKDMIVYYDISLISPFIQAPIVLSLIMGTR